MLLALAGVACASAEAPILPAELRLEQAVLAMEDGTELRMAQAAVDREGAGAGTDVRATVPGAPPLEIAAPQSDWDLRARVARFTGGVTATRADVTMTADTLTVSFKSADRLERAVAEGGVRVVQGARRAEGATAELTVESGEIVLTGAPVLSEGPNRMTGERITLWLDDERVRCDQCRLLVDGEAVRPR